MRVVLIGAAGQLGTDLARTLETWDSERLKVQGEKAPHSSNPQFQVIGLNHNDIEICDHERTRELLTRLQPDVVINTAAYHRVDECERNPEEAFRVNAIAVASLAVACRNLQVVLVHISSDYVFSGSKGSPYTESDAVDPINIYGISKAGGEMAVRYLWPQHFIIRSSGLYGSSRSSSKGDNFVERMLRLARQGRAIRVVNDQTVTPTSTRALARQIIVLIQTRVYGTYHATCQGACTWYDFTAKIFEYSRLCPALTPQTTAQSGAEARRPAYAVLENANLERIDLDFMPEWQEALLDYLQERKEP